MGGAPQEGFGPSRGRGHRSRCGGPRSQLLDAFAFSYREKRRGLLPRHIAPRKWVLINQGV